MERVSQKPGGGDFAAICHCAGPVWIPDVWPANSGRRSQQQFGVHLYHLEPGHGRPWGNSGPERQCAGDQPASYNLVFNNYVIYNSDHPNEALRKLVNLLQGGKSPIWSTFR